MKKLFALLLVVLTVLPLSLSVSAAEEDTVPEVLYATPTLDGQLDEAYTKSATLTLDSANAPKLWESNENGSKTSDAKLTTYLLWDKTYIYICSVVTDSTVVNTGIKDGWKADAAEYWIKYLGTVGKVAVDAFGSIYIDRSQITVSMCKAKTTKTDTGYITELAIPKLTFKDGDEIQLCLQLNDFFDAEGATGICFGKQTPSLKDKVVLVARTPDGEIVHDQTTPVVTNPPETTPEETEPTVTTTEETEPTTPEETKPTDTTAPVTTEAPEDTEKDGNFPILPVVIAAIAVVIVVVIVILKKRNH